MSKETFNSEPFKPVRTENNKVDLYIDGPDCLQLLLDEIRKARHFIHIQVMLFYSDNLGMMVARELAKKAKEGVEVRIMSDSDMSVISKFIEKYRSKGSSSFSDLQKIFSDAGIKYIASDKEAYKNYKWDEKRKELEKKGVPKEFIRQQDAVQEAVITNANTLDHRKIFIFDGIRSIVTGMNIGAKYLHDNLDDPEGDGNKWHGAMCYIEGPCSTELNKSFASKWMVREGDLFDYNNQHTFPDDIGRDVCTVYNFFPGMKNNYLRNYYIDRIKNCSGRFIIQNPYIDDDLFWKTLSGLNPEQAKKITIINPYKANGNDFGQNESAIKCRMREPFSKGVRFFSYQYRMSHIKISLDEEKDEVFYGSFNLNSRSSFHDFELNVLVKSHALSLKVKNMLEYDMSKSVEITDMNEFYKYPKLHPSCWLLDMTYYFE